MNSFGGNGVTGSWSYQSQAQAFAEPEMFWTVFSATLLALVVFGALVFAINMWTAPLRQVTRWQARSGDAKDRK